MTTNAKLFKYLDVKGATNMLRFSNLQFTNAARLNDPFECHPALFDFSNVPVNEYNLPPADFLQLKGKTDSENFRNSVWICSLSRVYDSLLMWAYYGNHKGVCIGLDMNKTDEYISRVHCKIYGPMKMAVEYRDIIDKLDYFHRSSVDFLRYQLSTKAKAWEHEQEVRLVLLDPIPASGPNNSRCAPMCLPYKPKRNQINDWRDVRAYPHIGSECFESLYLGIKISAEDKEEIIKEARKCNPDIKIYQMTVDPDAFKLKAVKFSGELSRKAQSMTRFRRLFTSLLCKDK